MEIWTVVVHYGDPERTRRAVAAVSRSTRSTTAIVVDHSGNWPDDPAVRVLRPGRNAGFAAGANVGARYALDQGASHLWFLNNDAEPTEDTLERLLRTAGEAKPAVMVGSLELDPRDADPQGRWTNRAPVLPASLRGMVRTVHGRLQAVDFLSGFSLLVSREAFERAGPWDESFFHYFEDVEYSVRAATAGVELILDCSAPTRHWRASGLGKGSETEIYYFFRNRLLAGARVRRQHPLLVLLTADPRHGLLPLLSRRRILARDWAWLRGAWTGTLDGLRGRTGRARRRAG